MGLVTRALAPAMALFAINATAVGLIDDNGALLPYSGAFSQALRARAEIVDFPPRANADFLRTTAVVPPKGFEEDDIPVRAEQHNKVLGTWRITARGEVSPIEWTGARESERPTSAACKAVILAAREQINARAGVAR